MTSSGSPAPNRFAVGTRKALHRAWQRVAAMRQRGPAAFAQALLARHGQGVQRSPRIAMLLALRARKQLTLLQPTSHHLSLHSTALHNSTTNASAAPVPMGRSDPEFAVPTVWMRHAPLAMPSVASASNAAAAEVLIRMVARIERTETLPTSQSSTRQSAPRDAGIRPPALATVHAARPDDMPAARPRPAPSTVTESKPVPAPAEVPAAAPAASRTTVPQALPPHEIERIADQVMGSIDRRIVAARERLGRP